MVSKLHKQSEYCLCFRLNDHKVEFDLSEVNRTLNFQSDIDDKNASFAMILFIINSGNWSETNWKT